MRLRRDLSRFSSTLLIVKVDHHAYVCGQGTQNPPFSYKKEKRDTCQCVLEGYVHRSKVKPAWLHCNPRGGSYVLYMKERRNWKTRDSLRVHSGLSTSRPADLRPADLGIECLCLHCRSPNRDLYDLTARNSTATFHCRPWRTHTNTLRRIVGNPPFLSCLS